MGNFLMTMREFLKKRGINASEENPGSMKFSVNTLNLICETTDKDPFFFRISLPRINNTDAQIKRLSEDIQTLNRSYKVVKIVKGADGYLWIIADLFIYSTDNIESMYDRVIQAMTEMINDYRKLEKEKGYGIVQS